MSVRSGPLFGDWFVVSLKTQPTIGRYEMEDGDYYDPELPERQIELYNHPIRGLCFWAEGVDDGTDLSGHVPWYQLEGMRIRRVSSPNEPFPPRIKPVDT